jgi:SOS response regulatory protein OraA/RecX
MGQNSDTPRIESAVEVDKEGGYIETLENIIKTKSKDYADNFQKKQKLAAYAMQRGFEGELVWEALANLGYK